MTRSHCFGLSRREDQDGHDRQTSSLAALAALLALVVIGLFLVRTLGTEQRVEDCLLAGRSNCDLALPPSHLAQAW